MHHTIMPRPRSSRLSLVRWLLTLWIMTWFPMVAMAGTVMVVGDSLSAAYGIPVERGWVSLLARKLEQLEPPFTVVNASISGETSEGARTRLPGLLQQHRPDIVIIELGGNDGLRGFPVQRMQANLRQMVEWSQAAGAKVLLAGMQIPPNYGQQYTQQFMQSYPDIAEQYDTALVPFLLEGIAVHPGLMQADGIHPTSEAQPLLLDNVWPALEPLLDARR